MRSNSACSPFSITYALAGPVTVTGIVAAVLMVSSRKQERHESGTVLSRHCIRMRPRPTTAKEPVGRKSRYLYDFDSGREKSPACGAVLLHYHRTTQTGLEHATNRKTPQSA